MGNKKLYDCKYNIVYFVFSSMCICLVICYKHRNVDVRPLEKTIPLSTFHFDHFSSLLYLKMQAV